MKDGNLSQQGFTVIELIAVLVISGIVAAVAGIGLVQIAQGTIFAKKNATMIQKSQIAVNIMSNSLRNLARVTSGDASSINFSTYGPDGTLVSHAITYADGHVKIDDDILIDSVAGFTLTYFNQFNTGGSSSWNVSRRIIQMQLDLSTPGDTMIQFTGRVTPRNL